MLTAIFRGMLARRVRLAMTGLAIALGTALASGSFVFTATLTHSLDSLFAQARTGTDVVVQHATPQGAVQGAGSGAARPIPALLLARILALPDVAAADGTVAGRAVLLGRNGKPLSTPFGVALSWPADAPFHAAFSHRAGSPPAGPGQVMIDRKSAIQGHFAVRDRIEIAIGGKAMPFTISGITGYGTADSIGGGSMAVFDLHTAQLLFGRPGQYDNIDVKATPGISPQRLRDQLASRLPSGVEAITAASAAASQARQLNGQLGILTYFFLGFAGVSLFVGAFVIWNTFSIMVSQRGRELALLRALGAGRGQVFGSVLAEAALLGTVAAAAGAGLGILLSRGLAALLSVSGVSLPVTGLVIPPAGVAASAATGLIVTVIAAVAPATRATKMAPVQALREVVPGTTAFSAGRMAGAVAVTGGGIALLLTGLFGGAPAAITAVGAAMCFVGVTIGGPVIARPLAYLASIPLTRLPAKTGALARGNTMRNPKRTSATAAALMIGLALIVAASVLVASSRALISDQIATTSKISLYVQATNADAGLSPRLAVALAATPGVQAVTAVRSTDASVAGTAHQNVDGVDPAAIGQFTDLGMRSGTLAALDSGELLVSQGAASGHHWRTGDEVQIVFGDYGISRLRIGGIFANVGPLSDYLVSSATFAADTGIRADSVDLVEAPSSARRSIQRALSGYPGAQLLDQAGYGKSRGAMLASLLNLITALLVLAIIIALLGIANTLALSIIERTRELGLLRAIGMGRGQLAQMIAAESVIIAVIGALLGTVLGLGLGAALADALTRSQQVTVAIPVGQVVTYIVAAALAGILAAIAPARRAARLKVLDAIAAE